MKLSGPKIYLKLVNDYKIVGEKGVINHTFVSLYVNLD